MIRTLFFKFQAVLLVLLQDSISSLLCSSTGVSCPLLYHAYRKKRCPDHGDNLPTRLREVSSLSSHNFLFSFTILSLKEYIYILQVQKWQLRPLGLLSALRIMEGRGTGAVSSIQRPPTPSPPTQQQHSRHCCCCYCHHHLLFALCCHKGSSISRIS